MTKQQILGYTKDIFYIVLGIVAVTSFFLSSNSPIKAAFMLEQHDAKIAAITKEVDMLKETSVRRGVTMDNLKHNQEKILDKLDEMNRYLRSK